MTFGHLWSESKLFAKASRRWQLQVNLRWPCFKAVALRVYEISRCNGRSDSQIHTFTVNPKAIHFTNFAKFGAKLLIGQASNFFSLKFSIFSYPSVLTYVLGAQKNRLIETVLLSSQNICFGWEIRKFILFNTLLTRGMLLTLWVHHHVHHYHEHYRADCCEHSVDCPVSEDVVGVAPLPLSPPSHPYQNSSLVVFEQRVVSVWSPEGLEFSSVSIYNRYVHMSHVHFVRNPVFVIISFFKRIIYE